MSIFLHHAASISQFNNADAWVVLSKDEQIIKQKIEKVGIPLKDWDIQINYGIKTGFNEAFIIDGKTKDALLAQDPNCREIIRPILRGKDIKKYTAEFADLWLIATHNGIKSKEIPRIDVEKDYPSVFEHLKQYQTELQARQDKGDHWTNLRNCAYWYEFESPKVVWQELSRTGNAFCYLEEVALVNNTVFIMTSCSNEDLKYITAILNSKISLFYLETVYNKLDETGWRWFKMAVEQIPIPRITDFLRGEIIDLVDEIQQNLKLNLEAFHLIEDLEKSIFGIYDFDSIDIEVLTAKLPEMPN